MSSKWAVFTFLAIALWSASAAAYWNVPNAEVAKLSKVTTWLVVPAGQPHESQPELVETLQQALRDQGATLVMDATALGDVASLGDTDIVARAANQPVDGVLIVRVFAGEQVQAVASAYRRDTAAPMGSFAASHFEGSAPPEVPIVAEEPEPPPKKPEPPPKKSEPPKKRLDRIPVPKDMVVRDDDGIFAILPDGSRVRGREIYEALNEPELADRYTSRRRNKTILLVAGATALGVGAAYGGVFAAQMSSVAADSGHVST